MRRSLSVSAVFAATAVLTGVVAAAAAASWIAVTSTDPGSHWRDLQGTFALSISFAVAGTFLGIIAVVASDWRSRRGATGIAALALAATTLGFWIWLIRRLG